MTTRRPAPPAVALSAAQWGEHVATWRRLQRLTSQQLAERAGVSRDTISRLKNGDPTVGFEVVVRSTPQCSDDYLAHAGAYAIEPAHPLA